MKDIRIDDDAVGVLESILKCRRGRPYEEVLDAAVWLYLHVLNGRIYPASIVQSFFSAMAMIYNLTAWQFSQLRKVYH